MAERVGTVRVYFGAGTRFPDLLAGFALRRCCGDGLVDGGTHGLQDILVRTRASQDVADLTKPVRNEQGDAVAAKVADELGWRAAWTQTWLRSSVVAVLARMATCEREVG